MTTTQRTALEEDISDGLEDIRDRLRQCRPEVLVQAFASLTHRIHAAEHGSDAARTLRAERLLVEQEILRRMHGQ